MDEDNDPTITTAELDPALAAAMGFSSFGQQSKKRKHSHPDASSPSSHAARCPQQLQQQQQQQPSTATGASATQLPLRSDAAARAASTSFAATHESEPGVGEEQAGPSAMSTSGAVAAGGGLAGFLARGREGREEDLGAGTGRGRAGAVAAAPPVVVGTIRKPLQELTQEELAALRRGVRDERGDVAYFLPSFVEDPWRGL